MLPLINVDERLDLITSYDDAIIEPTEGREPCRAIRKSECTINGGAPLVLTVRPLRSREVVRVMDASAASLTQAAMRAAEIGIVAISGENLTMTKPNEIFDFIDKVPHYAVLAVGSFLIEQSTATPDPTEPVE